ncbi:MAG: hypothetical protein WCP81_11035 [Actinomycetes bacterium]|jgi:hypothetical protein
MYLDDLPSEWRDDPERFGAALVAEMREPVRPDDDERPWATGLLRWGADGIDDDLLFSAVVAACGRATGWSERWLLADGVISDSINTRPAVRERWLAECAVNPMVQAVEVVPDIPDE